MPIKGLTCKESRSVGAIAIIGQLRKGAPKTGNKPGSDLDHFRFVTSDTQLQQIFEKLYGAKPGDSFKNGIKFFFAKSGIEENMPSTMAEYRGGSCWRMCDGENITGQRNQKGDWIRYPAHRRPACQKECNCTATGKLRIVVPEFKRFGIVEVIVGALNDLEHVSKQLQEIENRVLEHGGDLSKVPLILYRKTRGISCPNGGGKRARRQKSMIEVAIAPEFFNRSLAAVKRYSLASADTLGGDRPQLPPVTKTLDTTDFSDEFGKRPDLSYRSSSAWKTVQMAFDKARSYEEATQARESAIAFVESGALPQRAISQINIALQNARQRIDDSGVQPLPVVVVEGGELSVRDRIDAFSKLTGHETNQLGAIAIQLEMPEELPDWTDKELMKFRNNVYIDARIPEYGSDDTARAAFGEFWQGIASDDKDNDALVWKKWAEAIAP